MKISLTPLYYSVMGQGEERERREKLRWGRAGLRSVCLKVMLTGGQHGSGVVCKDFVCIAPQQQPSIGTAACSTSEKLTWQDLYVKRGNSVSVGLEMVKQLMCSCH